MMIICNSNVLIFLIIALIGPLAHCQLKWTRGLGTEKQYLLYPGAAKQDFGGARTLCEYLENAKLPEIMNDLENFAVKGMVATLPDEDDKHIWLGAMKRTSTQIVWLSTDDMPYRNFHGDEPKPNNLGIFMAAKVDGQWQTGDLTAAKTVVCEQTVGKKPENWIRGEGTNKEYLLLDEETKANFNDARRLCQVSGGRFPEIMNEAENLAVQRMMPSDGVIKGIWLGAYRRYGTNFSWLSATDHIGYTNFNDVADDRNAAVDDLIYLRTDSGKWYTDKGTTVKNVVCERGGNRRE